MKAVFKALLVFLLPCCAIAADGAPATQSAPIAIPRTDQFEIAASDGYSYRILVAVPKEPAPETGYGVVYLLDANTNFLTWTEAVRFQKGLTPTIVVGIAHRGDQLDLKRRFWDYTPKTPEENLLRRASSEGTVTTEGTGGEEAFYTFIEKTLKPEIGKRFKIDSGRQAIFGHSLGGRFVLHVLATHPESFQAYLASSPSVWWNNASLLDEIKALTPDQAKGRRVLITVGEFEQKTTPNTAPDRAEFFAKAKMVDNARETAARLKTVAGLDVLFMEYADENHGSVMPMSISRAVRFSLVSTK